jgi:Cu(I)/Ag(I) efflux system membrane protein CusA/SilA
MIWLYNQGWFMDFTLLGIDFRELFQIKTINLSVAVWVGFLALFGIATDDGVIMATYLQQKFKENEPASIQQIRESTVEGAMKRVRPAMMTTVTTLLALIPVLTSTGRGSDVMVPMAIPSFGGMTVAVLTVFVVPTLYCGIAELKFSWYNRTNKKTNLKNIEPDTNL